MTVIKGNDIHNAHVEYLKKKYGFKFVEVTQDKYFIKFHCFKDGVTTEGRFDKQTQQYEGFEDCEIIHP